MRTGLFILGGCLVWGIWALVARWLAASAQVMTLSVGLFICGWLFVAALNLGFGVGLAGYSFGEELPVFLLIVAAPVIFAIFVKWKWFSVSRG